MEKKDFNPRRVKVLEKIMTHDQAVGYLSNTKKYRFINADDLLGTEHQDCYFLAGSENDDGRANVFSLRADKVIVSSTSKHFKINVAVAYTDEFISVRNRVIDLIDDDDKNIFSNILEML